MKYMALIYGDPDTWEQSTPERRQEMYAEFGRFVEEAQRRQKMVDGGELDLPSTATTVRVRNGESLVTDGPFAETKEQLGGYFVLDCDNLDEAVELAGKIPTVHQGAIEIRPLVESPNPQG